MTRPLPGPGDFSPPDDPPSIYDSADDVQAALEDAGIPDYLASMLAEVACRGWSAERDGADLMRDLRRHLEPIINDYENGTSEDDDL